MTVFEDAFELINDPKKRTLRSILKTNQSPHLTQQLRAITFCEI
jgi:hypothetical protein